MPKLTSKVAPAVYSTAPLSKVVKWVEYNFEFSINKTFKLSVRFVRKTEGARKEKNI